jgi:hypothetical protein
MEVEVEMVRQISHSSGVGATDIDTIDTDR